MRSETSVVFVTPPVAPATTKDERRAPNSVLEFEYYNGLPFDVTLVHRTGLRVLVPMKMDGSKINEFQVRQHVGAGWNVNIDTSDLSHDAGQQTSPVATALLNSTPASSIRTGLGHLHSQSLLYRIDRVLLKRHGGAIYVPALDLVISTRHGDQAPKHPYSVRGILQTHRTQVGQKPLMTRLQYRIIDRDFEYGPRFVNITGRVYLIRPQTITEPHEAHLENGVYVEGNRPVVGNQGDDEEEAEFYGFDLADKELKLFRTYDEALTLGNPSDVYRKELEEKTHRLRVDKLEMDRQKQRDDAELDRRRFLFDTERQNFKERMQAREDELKNREAVLTAMEHDHSVRKLLIQRDTLTAGAISDQQAAARRETIEIIKAVPVIITGLLAVGAAVVKIRTVMSSKSASTTK